MRSMAAERSAAATSAGDAARRERRTDIAYGHGPGLDVPFIVFTALRFFTRRRLALIATVAGVVVFGLSTAPCPHWITAWLSDVGQVRIARNASVPLAPSDLFGLVSPWPYRKAA